MINWNAQFSEHAIRFWACVGMTMTGALLGALLFKIAEWFDGR